MSVASYDKLLHPNFIADRLSPRAMEALGTTLLSGLQYSAERVARYDLPTVHAKVGVVINTLPRWHEHREEYADRASFDVSTREAERLIDEDLAAQTYQPVSLVTLVRLGVKLTGAQRRRLQGTQIVRVPKTANDASALNLAVGAVRNRQADIMVIGDSCSSYATTEALRCAAVWLGGEEPRNVFALQGPRLPDGVSSDLEVASDLVRACHLGGSLLSPSNPPIAQLDLMAELAAFRVTPDAGEALFDEQYGNDGAAAAFVRLGSRMAIDDPAFARHTGRQLSLDEVALTLADQLRARSPNAWIAPPPTQ